MENLPLIDFIEHMEDAIFSTFFIERSASRNAETTPTKVSNKMYPPAFRPWPDFETQHLAAFAALRDSLGDGRHFASPYSVEVLRKRLAGKRAIADEVDVRSFIDAAIETPVSEILKAHLSALHPGVEHSVHFQNNAYRLLDVGGSSAKRTSPDKDLQPDRWVFLYELEDEININDEKTVNILVGECKSPQKLKITTLQTVMATMSHDTFFKDAIWGAKKMEQGEKQGAGTDNENRSDAPRVPGHVRVAKALCQTYHYMIGSGCEYGYIASGNSLVLLRVEEDLTLLYHCAGFPVPHVKNAEERRQQNRGLRQAHETAIAYLASLALWGSRSVPRQGHWIQSAKETCPRWPKMEEEKKNKDDQLASYTPRGPDSDDTDNAGGSAGGTGGTGGDSSNRDSGHLTTMRLPQASGPRKRGRSPQRRQEPSKDEVEAVLSPSASRLTRTFVVEPPRLPYCTQACLLGLVRGLALDNNCPNVVLHRQARRRDEKIRAARAVGNYLQSLRGSGGGGGGGGDDGHDGTNSPDSLSISNGSDGHPLTAAMVRARIVAQITANMAKDCECTAPHSSKARYGLFFKLAVTGYGYTFVGKGVQAWHRDVLEREATVYNAVPHVQGRLIPVFLGIVDLDRPMPMPNLTEIAHLMLMSYAGPDFTRRRQLPKDVNLTAECDRTMWELRRAGVIDEDVRDPNVAWNAEVRRVMHFDFDMVDLSCLPKAAPSVKKEEKDTSDLGDEEDEKKKKALPASRSLLSSQMNSNVKEIDSDVDGDRRLPKRMRASTIGADHLGPTDADEEG
ncbi:MAG: hypothetical protein STHCBS139747_003132 [Sporothrix thermara]